MRVAIPVFIAGILIALTVFSLTGIALPGPGDPTPPPRLDATATSLRPIVTTVTATAPAASTPAGAAGPQRGASPTPTPSGTPTPAGTAIASSEGAPLNAAQIVSAIQGAGMPVSGRDGRYTATVSGAQQQFSLFVFRSPSELQAEWDVQAGAAPRPRNGPPPALAYWNQNAVLTFSEIANADAARRIADVFLSLP